jgi:hypothetical protein
MIAQNSIMPNKMSKQNRIVASGTHPLASEIKKSLGKSETETLGLCSLSFLRTSAVRCGYNRFVSSGFPRPLSLCDVRRKKSPEHCSGLSFGLKSLELVLCHDRPGVEAVSQSRPNRVVVGPTIRFEASVDRAAGGLTVCEMHVIEADVTVQMFRKCVIR